MAAIFRPLVFSIGAICVVIGLVDVMLGLSWVPDTGDYTASLDGHVRFFGAVFAGYGAIWIWAARQDPVAVRAVRFLALVMFVGGLGRTASMVVHEVPHPLFIGLAVVELVVPPLVLVLASGYQRASRDLV